MPLPVDGWLDGELVEGEVDGEVDGVLVVGGGGVVGGEADGVRSAGRSPSRSFPDSVQPATSVAPANRARLVLSNFFIPHPPA